MTIKGKQILRALRELVVPSTPQEIVQHIAKKRKKKLDLNKLKQEVIKALTGGTAFGFIQMCNGKYYNLENTERQLKLIENERNKIKKLLPNPVLTDADNSNDNRLPKKRKRMGGDQPFDKEKAAYSPPKKRKRMGRDQSFDDEKTCDSPPEKRKRKHREKSFKKRNLEPPPRSAPKKRKRGVIAKAAHSTLSNSLKCVASTETKSISSDEAEYDLAMGAKMAKAKIDVIIQQIATNCSPFNAPSSSFSKDQRTSGILKQNVENPIAYFALKEAFALVKCKLDEIIDNISSYFEAQNIDANKSTKPLQFISSDSSCSLTNEVLSKMSVQNYLKEHNLVQNCKDLMNRVTKMSSSTKPYSGSNLSTRDIRGRASKYESPHVPTIVDPLECIEVNRNRNRNKIKSTAEYIFRPTNMNLNLTTDIETEDEDIAVSDREDFLLKIEQVLFDNRNNGKLPEDHMSLYASEATGVRRLTPNSMLHTPNSFPIRNPYRGPNNAMAKQSEPEDIDKYWHLFDFCPRCWFEKHKCKCDLE